MNTDYLFLGMFVASFSAFILTLGAVSTANLLTSRGRR